MTAKDDVEERIALEVDLVSYEFGKYSNFIISKTQNFNLKDELGDGYLDLELIVKDEENDVEVKLIFNTLGDMFCDLGAYDLDPEKIERASDIWKYFYLQTRL